MRVVITTHIYYFIYITLLIDIKKHNKTVTGKEDQTDVGVVVVRRPLY